MNSNEYIDCLMQKGVAKLYHANSVLTSLTYINNGGLFSREQVESQGLKQTKQKTDSSDKAFGVYNDIFFDSVDIHSRAKKINYYGPVSFVFDISVLENYEVKITKKNPMNWISMMSATDKYFSSKEEIMRDFIKGNFGQEITICNPQNQVEFSCLKEIILENPHRDDLPYFKNAKDALTEAIANNELGVQLSIRECTSDCGCREEYRSSDGFVYYRFRTK